MPVIVDENQGGKWVNDSWEIAKYLEKTYPDQPSLFDGPSGMLSPAQLCSSHPFGDKHLSVIRLLALRVWVWARKACSSVNVGKLKCKLGGLHFCTALLKRMHPGVPHRLGAVMWTFFGWL